MFELSMVHAVDYVEPILAWPWIKAPAQLSSNVAQKAGHAMHATHCTLHPLDERDTEANCVLSMVIVDQGLAVPGE
jgi:hypothetical protein